jgi:hypothetical protein
MEEFLVSIIEVIQAIRHRWLGSLALSSHTEFPRILELLRGADDTLGGLEAMRGGGTSEAAVKGLMRLVASIDDGITRESGAIREAYIEIRSYIIMITARIEAVEREFRLTQQQQLASALQPFSRASKSN